MNNLKLLKFTVLVLLLGIVSTNGLLAQDSPMSGESFNLNLATLDPGQTVTITFCVVIDNPLNATEVCNQGTVSGSNFNDVLTDDPDDPTSSADQTCTPVGGAQVEAIVINEVDYDQPTPPTSDSGEFIELKNVSDSPIDLTDWTVELVNGSVGAVIYNTITLPGVSLAAGDYFVICGDAANVANCDLDVTPNINLIQNGSPDAIGLRNSGGVLVDAVSYEGNTGAPYTEGSGTGLEDPGTTGNDNLGISRFPDGIDTDQNNDDFILRCITPGEPNIGIAACPVEFPFMTIWAVNDHTDGKLQYYTLDVASPFLNIEGDILGITGDKDIEDLIIDSSPTPENPLPNDGTFYLVNNVGTSTIYSLDFSDFDGIPTTPVTATLVGSTGLPTTPNGSSPEEISSLLIHNGTLYGLSKRSKKLYTISTVDGSVTQVFTLSVTGDFRTDAMTFRPPTPNNNGPSGPTGVGTVYLVKTDDTGGESEIWKFDSFPGGDITYVRQIETSGKVEALTAHPDGFLYASDETTLYQISVDSSFIAFLAEYTVDIEGMDFFYDIEVLLPTVPTRQFIPISPVPVELVSFTAEAKSGKVVLNWQTATEVNNYGFEVERQVGSMQSTVGNWTKIGFVDGHGNSNSPKRYNFTDSNPTGGTTFSYRLKQIDNDGTYEYSDIVEVEFVPTEFVLFQNYPNPFNPTTKIKYSIPKESNVTIKVFDILGEEVMTLVNEKQEAGSYDVDFDGSNLVSGIYIYQMQAGEFSNTKKMLIIK